MKERLQADAPYIYSIPFYVIHVCLSTTQVRPHSFDPRATATVCVCGSKSCRYTHPVTHTSTVPLLLCSPIVLVLNAEKNRYPLINSKAVKILSSPKKFPCPCEKCRASDRKSYQTLTSRSMRHRKEITQCKSHVSSEIMNML